MNITRSASVQKYASTYDKLLQGVPLEKIAPKESPKSFFANLFALDVDREYLENKLKQLPKDQCLGTSKGSLNSLFVQCLSCIRAKSLHAGNALEILLLLTKCLLAKVSTGWEVMEILAGGVGESDKVFMDFVEVIDTGLIDIETPASTRHLVLQVGLVFICGVGQMSPGAYFLRRDLYPSLAAFIKSPDTRQFTFEAVLLLALLANYHKSDAGKLNPYLQRMRECTDFDLMHQVCWTANFALDMTVKAYQAIADDSPPTLASSISSVVLSLRPDRALASKEADPPRELFKHQPIEAAVILLPLFEFIRTNQHFCSILMDYMSPNRANPSGSDPRPFRGTPLPLTLLTLSSYFATHATSTSSPRAQAYANLSLHILLAFTTSDEILDVLSQPLKSTIRICRQRQPYLEPSLSPLCTLLDCCILWLRHNLHLRLEVPLYIVAVRTCYCVIWFLQKRQVRLDYHWPELWRAIFALLDFLSARLDTLNTTGGIEQLACDAIDLLYLCLCRVDAFLPTPLAVHELVYEVARSASILRKQVALLKSVAAPPPVKQRHGNFKARDSLPAVVSVADYYEEKIKITGARSAREGIQVVAREVDKEGLHVEPMKAQAEIEEPLKHVEDILSFARIAYGDGLALMP